MVRSVMINGPAAAAVAVAANPFRKVRRRMVNPPWLTSMVVEILP